MNPPRLTVFEISLAVFVGVLGWTDKQIGDALGISETNVWKRLCRLRRKTGAVSRAAILFRAFPQGGYVFRAGVRNQPLPRSKRIG